MIDMGVIQSLWSGYGKIIRYGLQGGELESVVVKHVCLPRPEQHPRGWNTDISHQRKLKSYAVETQWYKNYSGLCDDFCKVPRCFTVEAANNEILIVLEDLDVVGYPQRKSSVNKHEIEACLSWLAHFHAIFLGAEPNNLWETGTYWHLATRPDELAVLSDEPLKKAAAKIDRLLAGSSFKTFVHGDAKLANFCFSKSGTRVAAVDFQYAGGGCGMKDVAYFIGSCLDESECEKHADMLLNYYFLQLDSALKQRNKSVDFAALEKDWRNLYPAAWADFHRFIKGWSPGHWKINSYSERITRKVIEGL